MRAVSDSGPTSPNQEKPEMIQNLFDLLKLVSANDTVQFFDDAYNNCNIRYGDLKKQLAEDAVNYLTPIRERIREISSNEKYLNEVLAAGGEKARNSAIKTVKEVREIIGLKGF